MYQNHDFSHISRMLRRLMRGNIRIDSQVTETLKKEFSSLGKEFNELGEEIKREFQANSNPSPPPHRPKEPPKQHSYAPQHTQVISDYVPKSAPGTVIGILFLVFGGIGLAVFFLLSLCALIAMLFNIPIPISSISGFLGLLGLGCGVNGILIWRGAHLTKRNKRYKQYQKEINNSEFCPIALLSSASGQTESFVVKDLQKMIRHGMFPDGHLDTKQTCLILNYETYQQYLRAEEEMKRRQQEEAEQRSRKEEQKREEEKRANQRSGNPDLDRAIAEGHSVILRIREANDRIPGEEISEKISQLEQITSKIFEYVAQHPNKLPEIRKFMNYYLPTTLKLLNAYQELDRQPVQGENISRAKAEIQATLDTINQAFEKLLDSLFGEIALDISTDISVLQSMLAQEGLTDSDFSK